jgi:hypothetical protein
LGQIARFCGSNQILLNSLTLRFRRNYTGGDDLRAGIAVLVPAAIVPLCCRHDACTILSRSNSAPFCTLLVRTDQP